MRTGDLKQVLGGVSQKMLTQPCVNPDGLDCREGRCVNDTDAPTSQRTREIGRDCHLF